MNQQAIIEAFEARARAIGASMSRVCASAGVHPTTFSRWKRSERNPNPIGANLRSLERIDAALSELEQAAQQAA